MAVTIESNIENRTLQLGREIYDRALRERRGRRQDINSRVMDMTIRDETLKVRLFRFVDVLPMLRTPEEVVDHLIQYLGDLDGHLPGIIKWGLERADKGEIARRAAALIVQNRVHAMVRKFIAGSDLREASSTVARMRAEKRAFSLDILGEVALSESEAEGYQKQYLDLIRGLSAEAANWQDVPQIDSGPNGPLPKVNVSVKLSSLYSQWEPADPEGTAEAVKQRLRPILSLARELGAFIHFDMEYYSIKDLTLKIFREVLMEPEYREWPNVGIAIQGYLRDSERDILDVIDWVKVRGTPVTVRLVRGAYWDYETIIARQRNWPIPVYTRKHETDRNYERLTEILIENYPSIHTGIGTHNTRSIARAMAIAENLSLPELAVEYQMLYGMGDELKTAVVGMSRRLRVYTPFGELIPGMAYLVRRLLENTSNESFLRQGFADGVSIDELLKSPEDAAAVEKRAPHPAMRRKTFINEPERDFSRTEHREAMKLALAKARTHFGEHYPLIIGRREVSTDEEMASLNPSKPSEVVGRVAWAGENEAQEAIRAAKEAFLAWRDTPAEERADILFKAAEIIREERDELAAWEVYEEGKGWREADADICETIDYLNYYGRQMLRLAKPRRLGQVPGESNEFIYQPRGVAAIIPPWNFPMAILAGMTTAALVTGNTAVVKPASQSPIVGAKFVDALRRAGIPDGVVNLVMGPGDVVGETMVTSPDVDIIAFTGSRAVGTRIFRLASEVQPGQDHLKKVIAEMGGKNAIIIDSDADLDEAVSGTVISAFGYQGQKCSASSRVIVLEPIYDKFLMRLFEAARSLKIGHADDPGSFMGPIIDAVALARIRRYIEIGKRESELVYERKITPVDDGYFLGPVIFAGVRPDARIAQEEIFGPVIAVTRAGDMDEAIEIAMSTQYCLTGGIYSRSPANIEKARREFRVGNLYINRKITGAIVGRQPFGGFKMSGIGSKAGGPDYLLQFMEPRVITENTMRRGFAPTDEMEDTAGI